MCTAALSLAMACLLCACDYSGYEQGYPIADRALRQTDR